MPKSLFKILAKTLSTTLILALLIVGLPSFTPNIAFANNDNVEALQSPSYLDIYSEATTANEVSIVVSSDVPASLSMPIILYNSGNPVGIEIVTESDEWNSAYFTVPRPADGVKDYYATFGAQTSDIVSVYDSLSSEVGLTLTADNQVFTVDNGPPDLEWTTVKDLNYGDSIYIIYEETGEIVHKGSSSGSYSGDLIDFTSGPARTYRAYIAEDDSWPSNLSDLINVQGSSNEVIIQRAPWNIELSVSSEKYTGDEDLPIISWSANQSVSLVEHIYSLHIVNVDSNEIVATIEPAETEGMEGEVEGLLSYNQKTENFKAVLASYDYDDPVSYSDLQDIQAESNVISTDHEDYSISLSMDKATYETGEMPILTWRVNQRLNDGYCVAVKDSSNEYLWLGGPTDSEGRSANLTTDRAVSSGVGERRSNFEDEQWVASIYKIDDLNCGIPTDEDEITWPIQHYNGFLDNNHSDLLDYNDSLATSNIVKVEWPQQYLTLTADKYEFSHNDNLPTIKAQLNQGLARTQELLLVDRKSGRVIASESGPNSLEISPWPMVNDYPSLIGLPEGEHPTPGAIIYEYSGWPNDEYGVYVGDFSREYVAYLVNYSEQADYSTEDQILDNADIAAVSQPIIIKRTPWSSLKLEAETRMDCTGADCFTDTYIIDVSVNANQAIYPISYREAEDLYFIDENGRRVTDYTTISDSEYHFGLDVGIGNLRAVMVAPGSYSEGEIIPKESIIAKSNPISISSSIREADKWAAGYNSADTACEQTCLGDPVNTYTGEFFENEEDLAIDGPIPLSFARSNGSSIHTKLGTLGYGWTHNFAMRVEGLNSSTLNTVSIIQENGSTAGFYRIVSDGENEEYFPVAGIGASLIEDNDELLFTRRGEAYTYIFDMSGQLIRIEDTSSNALTMNYIGDKLQEIASSSGQSIKLQWNENLISSITDGQRTVSYTYDENKLILVKSSLKSGVKSYSYDSQNRVNKIIHPNGGVYSNVYDSDGRVTLQTDPLNGNTLFAYQFTDYGQITTSTLPDETVIKDTYDLQGRLIHRELAHGSSEATTYSYHYNLAGQKTEEIGPSGRLASYTYSSLGDLTSVTDALKRTTRFTYTDSGKLVETIDAAGGISTNNYDESERLISTKDPNGNVSEYSLNENGTVKSIAQVESTGNQTTSFGYDSRGFLTTVTSPTGSVDTTTSDQLGHPLTRTDALGRVSQLDYDSHKQLIKETSPGSASHEYSYDAAGRVTKEADALGREVIYEYDAMDNVVKMTTGYGSTVYSYDNLQRLVKVVHPGGGEEKWKYDSLGRVIESTDANGAISKKTYFPNGLLKKSIDGRNKATTYTYDKVGNLTKTVGPGSIPTVYKYDNLNRLTSTTLADGFVESSTYDSNGNKLTSTRNGVEKTSYKYDHRGLLTKITYPDAVAESRNYNADGLLTSVIERGGHQVDYSYDLAGQVIGVTRPDGSVATYSYTLDSDVSDISFDGGATVSNSYTYNVAGQLISEATASELTTYSYDAMGNMTRRGPPGENGVSYEYDSIGRLTSTTYPSGVELTQSYNIDDTLSSLVVDSKELIKYSYDLGQNVVSTTYDNGLVDNRTYDGYSRLSSIGLKKNKASVFSKAISYTNTGLISTTATTVDSVDDSREYGYSAVRRLESVLKGLESSAYSHDTSSNLLSGPQGTQEYSTDGTLISSVSGAETASYDYDLRGNRLSKTVGSKSAAFTWTQDDKLASAISTGSNPFTVDYTYGADGLLSTRTEDGNSSTYVWDTSRSVPTMLEDGDYSYLYGVGTAPFAQIKKSTGVLTYLHGDERESIVAATDSSGDLLWSRSYDEYGSQKNETSHKPSSVKTAFGYAGQYQDKTTGLYNLRARWYDPQTASFLSKDPALLLTGESHAYASGDPLSFTDPLGLASEGSTQIAATIDGLVGMPLGSQMMNGISPDSVDNCSSLYTSIAGVTSVASFLIPGIGALKVGKLTSVAEYNGLKLAGSYNELSRLTPGRRLIMEHNHIPTWNFIKKSTNEYNFTRGTAPTIAMDYADHRALDTTLKSRTHAQSQIDRGLSFREAVIEDWQEILTKNAGKYETSLEAYLNEYGKRFGITANDFK